MSNIIKETENYSLQIGLPVTSKDPSDAEVYQIVNKKYKIIEMEVTVLPQAIKYLHDLEAGLAAVNDMYNVEKEVVVPFHPGKSKILN